MVYLIITLGIIPLLLFADLRFFHKCKKIKRKIHESCQNHHSSLL